MVSESTSTYTMEDWVKASRGKIYLVEDEEYYETESITSSSPNKATIFQREDFEKALQKVSRRVKK